MVTKDKEVIMLKRAIYGTGVYALRVYNSFRVLNISIDFFVVTQKKHLGNYEIDEIPVYDLCDIHLGLLENLYLYVAVDEKYHDEIKESLLQLDKYLKNTTVEYLLKSDIDAIVRKARPIGKDNVFLKTVNPVSRLYGNDRGMPIDRYYIERYLLEKSWMLPQKGMSLEVGEDTYSKRFFPYYDHEILNYSDGMDLTKIDSLPKERYDLFICTQVFHQIYEVEKAIKGAHYLLKHNGVMLATVCGNITKLARNDEYEHYWGFSQLAIEKMVKSVFGSNVTSEAYGNCMAATAFIQGLSYEDVNASLLDVSDYEYTICISVTARKN